MWAFYIQYWFLGKDKRSFQREVPAQATTRGDWGRGESKQMFFFSSKFEEASRRVTVVATGCEWKEKTLVASASPLRPGQKRSSWKAGELAGRKWKLHRIKPCHPQSSHLQPVRIYEEKRQNSGQISFKPQIHVKGSSPIYFGLNPNICIIWQSISNFEKTTHFLGAHLQSLSAGLVGLLHLALCTPCNSLSRYLTKS